MAKLWEALEKEFGLVLYFCSWLLGWTFVVATLCFFITGSVKLAAILAVAVIAIYSYDVYTRRSSTPRVVQ